MTAKPDRTRWRTFRDEPETPWTVQYAAGKTQPPLSNGKSWIDPTFPEMDPVSLDIIDEDNLLDDDGNPQPIPKPSPQELDDLFRSERFQTDLQYGLRTWEAAVLAKVRAYTAEEEEAHTTGEEIAVDESKWLKVWRRDRWVIEFTQRRHFSGEKEFTWSMADEGIWGEFRKVVQLADNILRAATEDAWLATLLAKENGIESLETEVPHGSGTKRKIWRMKESPSNLPSAAKIREILEDEHFYRPVLWSFHDQSQRFERAESLHDLAVTWSTIVNGRAQAVISLDVVGVRQFVDPTSRGDGKRGALYGLAVTMVHELMHYLNNYLHTDTALVNALGTPTPSGKSGTCPMYEIYGPGEKWQELGFSMETATFGGDIWGLESQNTGAHFRTTNARSLVRAVKKQPHMSISHWNDTYDLPWTEPNHATFWPVPASWTWSLAARDFWAGVVSKYGTEALRRPAMLRRRGLIMERWYPLQVPRPAPAEWVPGFAPREWERETLREVARQLAARRALYHKLRPWFPDAFAMWQQTPFSWVGMLQLVHRAREVHFARRGAHDQRDADGVVRELCAPYTCFLDPHPDAGRGRVMLGSMIGDDPGEMHTEVGPVAWFFRAVGFLAQAALPVVPEARDVPEKEPLRGHGRQRRVRTDIAVPARERRQAEVCIQMLVADRWTYAPFTVQKRHHYYPRQGQGDTLLIRTSMIGLARWCFNVYAALCRVPAGVRTTFTRAADALRDDVFGDAANGYASWLDLAPVLPVYPGRWEPQAGMADVTGLLEFRASATQGWAPGGTTTRLGTDVEDRHWGEEPEARTDVPTWAQMAGPAGTALVVPAGRRLRRHEVDYFTVAELYDRARRLGDMFVLLGDGHDLNLYNRSIVDQAVGLATDEEIAAATTRTYYGLQLRPEAADGFLAALPEELPFGRLTKILRAEDVATGDGESGRPLWIQIQREVFDITHLRCDSDADLQAVLESRPGGDPSEGILNEGYSIENVAKSLGPWRVGILPPDAGTPPEDRHAVQVFAEATLRRHEFKQTGMYMALGGVVYDITEYADFHPGGMAGLAAHAGRDATDVFRREHANHEDILRKMQGLVVGRLVASRPHAGTGAAIGRDEIQIYDDIYSVSELESSGENDALADALAEHRGTDATPRMQDQEDDGPLMQLFPLKGFIVAVAEKPLGDLSQMTPDELRLFDGDVNEAEGWKNGAYLAVDDVVYDMTDAVAYGLSNEINVRLMRHLGRAVDDAELADYVRTQCRHRVCARLVGRRVIAPGGGAFMWHPQRPLPIPLQMTNLDREEPASTAPPKRPGEDAVAPFPGAAADDAFVQDVDRFLTDDVFVRVPSWSEVESMVMDLSSEPGGGQDVAGNAADNKNTSDKQQGGAQRDTIELNRRREEIRRRERTIAEDEYVDLFNRPAAPGELEVPEGERMQVSRCSGPGGRRGQTVATGEVVPVTTAAVKKRDIRFVGDSRSGSGKKRKHSSSDGSSV